MQPIHIIYPHKTPVWSRPRANARGNRVIMFDPKLSERKQISMWAKQFFKEPLLGPLKLEVIAYYATTKKKEIGSWKITRPDIDNACLKSWADLLQGVAYLDDNQLASVSCQKKWGETDCTHVFVSKL